MLADVSHCAQAGIDLAKKLVYARLVVVRILQCFLSSLLCHLSSLNFGHGFVAAIRHASAHRVQRISGQIEALKVRVTVCCVLVSNGIQNLLSLFICNLFASKFGELVQHGL